MKNIHSDYINISLIFSFTVLIIVIYFLGYLINFDNPSDIDLLSKECFIFIKDYWGLSHIILFFIVTYIYPNRYIFIMLCGILWEIIEYITKILNNKFNTKLNLENGKKEDWWYGRSEDILYNSIGIILALFVRRIVK
jgi:hypothetical protein